MKRFKITLELDAKEALDFTALLVAMQENLENNMVAGMIISMEEQLSYALGTQLTEEQVDLLVNELKP